MLRRSSIGRALWPLDSNGQARTRLGGPLLHPLGIPGRFFRSIASSDSHLHRPTGGSGPHAARKISPLHFSRIVALVFGAGVSRDESRRELARSGQILSQIRRRHRGSSLRWRGVVYLEPLAASAEDRKLNHFCCDQDEVPSPPLFASCDPTICHLPSRFTTTSM